MRKAGAVPEQPGLSPIGLRETVTNSSATASSLSVPDGG